MFNDFFHYLVTLFELYIKPKLVIFVSIQKNSQKNIFQKAYIDNSEKKLRQTRQIKKNNEHLLLFQVSVCNLGKQRKALILC